MIRVFVIDVRVGVQEARLSIQTPRLPLVGQQLESDSCGGSDSAPSDPHANMASRHIWRGLGAPVRTRNITFSGPRRGFHFLFACFLLTYGGPPINKTPPPPETCHRFLPEIY
jgi:hypothetical protein